MRFNCLLLFVIACIATAFITIDAKAEVETVVASYSEAPIIYDYSVDVENGQPSRNHMSVDIKSTPDKDTGINIITSAAAVITALVAVISFVKTSKQMEETMKISRKHNVLSVRPFVEFYLDDYGNKGATITLDNKGIGPAVLLKLTSRNKETGEEWTSLSDAIIEELTIKDPDIPKKLEKLIETQNIFFTGYNKNIYKECLAVNTPITLFEIKKNNEKKNNKNSREEKAILNMVKEAIANFEIQVVYTDFYDSENWTAYKDLIFFRPDRVIQHRLRQGVDASAFDSNNH